MPAEKEQRLERRLAAIFAADVAGYSRLMSQDETGTLRALAAAREIMDRLIRDHGGRIANTAGDSVLAEFPSVDPNAAQWLEALLCSNPSKAARQILREVLREAQWRGCASGGARPPSSSYVLTAARWPTSASARARWSGSCARLACMAYAGSRTFERNRGRNQPETSEPYWPRRTRSAP